MSLPRINRYKNSGWAFVCATTICTFLLLQELFGLIHALQAKSWPVVTGTIFESRAIRGCGRGNYYPLVRYTYRYDDRAYEGHRIAFGYVGCFSKQNAEAFLSDYRAGQSVNVWVKSDSPGEATLTVGNVLSQSWLAMAVLSLMILSGSVLGLKLLRQHDAA